MYLHYPNINLATQFKIFTEACKALKIPVEGYSLRELGGDKYAYQTQGLKVTSVSPKEVVITVSDVNGNSQAGNFPSIIHTRKGETQYQGHTASRVSVKENGLVTLNILPMLYPFIYDTAGVLIIQTLTGHTLWDGMEKGYLPRSVNASQSSPAQWAAYEQELIRRKLPYMLTDTSPTLLSDAL